MAVLRYCGGPTTLLVSHAGRTVLVVRF